MFRKKKQNQPKQKKLSSESSSELTFLEHFHELRKRLFWVVAILVVASAVGLQFKDHLIGVVMAPLHGQKLIYLTPGGGFSFIFTLSLYFGALIAIPFIIYQIFRFLQPILGKTSRRFVAIFIIISTLLAVSGALFGYFVTIPAALNFLATFAGDAVIPSLTAESYLSFVVTYVLGLALLFQIPLLLFIFDHVSPFQPGTLSKTQDKVIIGATALSALITPTPDAFNMAIVAVPIVIVYELGVIAVWARHQKRRRQSKKAVVATSVKSTVNDEDDEPLTALIEELTAKPKKLDVPTPQLQSQARRQPQTQSPAIAQPQPAQRRTMDGFVRTQPRVPVVPPRPLPARATSQPQRTIRSIDGFAPSRANS